MRHIKCNLCMYTDTKFLFFGTDRLYKTTKDNFTVVECKNCGLVYLNPQPEEKELQKFYPKFYGPYGDGINTFKPSKAYEIIRKLKHILKSKIYLHDQKSVGRTDSKIDKSKIKFLDFGCAKGVLLETLRKVHPNWELHGLDISSYASKKASQKSFIIHCGTLASARYPNDYFDIVNASQVVEHLNDPLSTLREVNRILKPGGLFQLDIPNYASLGARLFKTYWYPLDIPRHLYFFTPHSIQSMLEKSGFSVNQFNFDYIGADTIWPHSIDYLLHGKNTGIHPVLFHLLKPLNFIVKKMGVSDLMFIEAKKSSTNLATK